MGSDSVRSLSREHRILELNPKNNVNCLWDALTWWAEVDDQNASTQIRQVSSIAFDPASA